MNLNPANHSEVIEKFVRLAQSQGVYYLFGEDLTSAKLSVVGTEVLLTDMSMKRGIYCHIRPENGALIYSGALEALSHIRARHNDLLIIGVLMTSEKSVLLDASKEDVNIEEIIERHLKAKKI